MQNQYIGEKQRVESGFQLEHRKINTAGLQLSLNQRIQRHPQAINIVFQNISYLIQVEQKDKPYKFCDKQQTSKKQILKNLTGIFKAGEVSAILGCSGAGKTSLLNIIACRIIYQSDGKLYANRNEYTYGTFGDFASYVMQKDYLMETLTVRQTLTFAANLKLNLSKQQRKKKVLQLSKSMKLQKCLDVIVGGQTIKGISGGERKRTSIAFELISEPQVIMLDQPTSGLDSLTSFIIVDYLTKYAHQKGKTVIMTIHQPNSDIYDMFDRLFLMAEGQFIYQGPASQALDYFKLNFRLNCGQYSNPAEFLIQIIHPQNSQNLQRYPQYFQVYKERQTSLIQKQIQRVESLQLKKYENKISFETTFKTLLHRDLLNILRNPILFKARLFQSIFLGLYVGGLYYKMGEKDLTVQTNWLAITGLLYFLCIISLTVALTPTSLVFPLERVVFQKEVNSRLYSISAYFLSRNIIQIPYLVVMPLLFDTIFYWMIKLSPTAKQFFIFYSITVLINLCGNSLGLLLGSIIRDAKSVATAVPLVLLPFMLFSGQFKNTGNIPYWCGWIQYISPLKYGFAGVTINSLKHRGPKLNELNIDVGLGASIGLLIVLCLGYRLLSLFILWLRRNKIE